VAIEIQQKFHKRCCIDTFCYRRFGHNEAVLRMFNPGDVQPTAPQDDAAAI
jgi:2-oxoglutarate dehydrogenase complex dehydrogenase (E1) component-like enzyme